MATQRKKSSAPSSTEPSSAPELSADVAKEWEHHTKANKTKRAPMTPSKKAADEEVEEIGKSAVESEMTPDDRVITETELADDPLEDSTTDRAVDDIVRQESDEVLAAEDAKTVGTLPPERRGFWRSIGHFFARWWQIKWLRWLTILLLLAAIGTAAAIPKMRYAALNAAGVRSSLSLTVTDDSTLLPLKNVLVTVGSQQAVTNSSGVAKLANLKLGPQTLVVRRIAFAAYTQKLVVGWGSNPLGTIILHATGAQYTILAKDYVSGKGIATAEITSGEATAEADKNGKLTLTLPDSNATSFTATVTAAGYHDVSLTISASTTETTALTMVPTAKEVFVSKQSGTYDLVSMDVDGKNRKTLLQGTGNEGANVVMVTDPANQEAAMVATRDNTHDADGFLLSALTVVNISTGVSQTVDHAEQIQIIDWIGNKIIYEEAVSGASAANPGRYRLISFDYTTNSRVQLASANQFNAAMSIQGQIYYAVSSTDPHAQAAFFRIKPDGTSRQTIFSQEVWSAFLTDYNTIALQSPNGWYSYAIGGTAQHMTAPTTPQSRLYFSGPNGQQAWTDTRDGQGVLLSYSTSTGKDTTLATQIGLGRPVRWLNDNIVVYRVATPQETADYAVSISGGTPKKLADVVNTYGFTQGT